MVRASESEDSPLYTPEFHSDSAHLLKSQVYGLAVARDRTSPIFSINARRLH